MTLSEAICELIDAKRDYEEARAKLNDSCYEVGYYLDTEARRLRNAKAAVDSIFELLRPMETYK